MSGSLEHGDDIIPAEGDEITYAMVVTNTGNTCLKYMAVTSDQLESVTCPPSTTGTLCRVPEIISGGVGGRLSCMA